jgi:DNA polymerase III epsilon subunit-like protein
LIITPICGASSRPEENSALAARTIMPSMSSLRSKTGLPECPADYGQPQGKNNSFIALDVETANSNISSVCQIALVWFVVGEPVEVWHSLVNPREPFAALNVSLHGIDAVAVQDSPTLTDVMRTVAAMLAGKVVASHMPFDRIALEKACSQHCIPQLTCFWIDTARVARLAWPRFAKRGYGLRSLASWHGIDFRHHDAVEDASTAGRILAHAVAETGISLERWLSYSTGSKSRSRKIVDKDLARGTRNSRLSSRYAAAAAERSLQLGRVFESEARACETLS